MDPLTHTLVGASLAETPWARRTALALPTLLIASNLPDVDAFIYLVDSDLALYHRRGWTHGILALAVLPVLVAGLVLAWNRWVRSRSSGGPPVRPRRILGFAFLGVLVHLMLDWLNTYGVRYLMPFDGRWFYGDVLHIVDPVVWLLLGGSLFLLHSKSRRGLLLWALLGALATLVVFYRFPFPDGMRVLWVVGLLGLAALRWGWLPAVGKDGAGRLAKVGFVLCFAYLATQLAAEPLSRRLVSAELTRISFRPVEALMVGPVPGNPFLRDVLAVGPDSYRFGRFHWLPEPRLALAPRAILRREPDEAVRAARSSERVRGLVGWSRFPYHEVVETPAGLSVYLLDARYARSRRTDFGGAVVHLDRDLNPIPEAGKAPTIRRAD